jgi:hypothetical protein
MFDFYRSDELKKSARISDDGLYRYSLERDWDESLPKVLWCCLNPSTADDSLDDPSVRKMIGFSKLFGYGGLVLVNLFAFRETNPAKLPHELVAIGMENDWCISGFAVQHPVICAWGSHKIARRGRAWEVRHMLHDHQGKIYCLGKTKDGSPKHPLYLPYETKLEPYGLV